MHKPIRLFMIALYCVLLQSCGEARKQEGIREGLRLLYVTPEKRYFDDARIPGSTVFVPGQNLEKVVKDWAKTDDIIVYCGSYGCRSSHDVAQQLDLQGFARVRVLEGGMAHWYRFHQKDGLRYKVAGPAKAPFLSAYAQVSEDRLPVTQDERSITVEELVRLIGK